MTWRRVPPVTSPIAPASLVLAAAAAAGLVGARRAHLASWLAEAFRGDQVILTDSGTSALVIAMRAVAGRTGLVALPAYACIDLAAAAIRAGVGIRLYDQDPATLGPDPESVDRVLGRGVDALIVAPLFGYAIDHEEAIARADRHGVPLVEDAAQSAGGEFKGKRIGSFGDLSVLSFGRGKGTTGGSGGALIARGAWADRIRGVLLDRGTRGARETVALAAQWLLARPSLYAVPSSLPWLRLGEMVYHPAGEPREIAAAASRVAARALAANPVAVAERRARAAELFAACARSRALSAVEPVAGAAPGYLRFAVYGTRRPLDAAPDLGVLPGYPVTLDQHPATAPLLASGEESGVGARFLRDRLLTVPTHPRTSEGDRRALARWIEAQ